MSAQIDLWCVDLGRMVPSSRRLSALLDEEERERAGRFPTPAGALRYSVPRGALRVILSRYTGVGPRDIRFSWGEHGKPFLRDGGPHFNLSHSGGLALVAVCAGCEVGVDVEKLRTIPQAIALAERFFSRKEACAIAAHAPRHGDLRFLRSWTALEAVLKAEGTGLAGDRGGLELDYTGSNRARVSIAADAVPSPTWSVRWLPRLPGAPGHVAAVAARAESLALRLKCFP